MSKNAPQYPGQVYDGTSPTRSSRTIDRGSEAEDHDQLVAEIIATQEHLNGLIAGLITVTSLNVDVFAPTTVPDVTGAKGAAGEPALGSLLTGLVALGLVTDSTT